MNDLYGIDFAQAELVIARIAEIATAVGWQAGVGGMETAGSIVSYLAKHPRDIEPCLRFGVMELPADWHERGALTWHRQDGKVVSPEWVRRARTIKQLAEPKP
ncbi:hypothetical protein [uncultured Sphingomonas sp.]|uniref:hypothetical protein n=1 Tax=uncultured Sphingomonas sp. TaxID=158754 RepID=UPI0025E1AFF5|nr:hypothetical protein [uncultured Sphingomonas sp.]